MAVWKEDEGYDLCKVARFGNLAVVIVGPYWTATHTWGFQVYDEADEEAMDYGEYTMTAEGFKSEAAAIAFAEKHNW